MTDRLSIALAQVNFTVGDIAGNLRLIRAKWEEAAQLGADLVLFGELSVCGYPPEDLVLRPSFQAEARAAVEALAAESGKGRPGIVVGAPWVEKEKLYNAALLIDEGKIAAVRFKHELPNYGVFDEKRVFAAGPLPGPVAFRGVRLGLMICEDMWFPDVTECLAETGAEILVIPNGSPFDAGKKDVRLNLAVARVVESGLPLVYVNQVGGQDELVFDGGSFVLNTDRTFALNMPDFVEGLALSRWQRQDAGWVCVPEPKDAAGAETIVRAAPLERLEAIWLAMTTGLRDYVRKNRFPGVVIGLSGGIDSALTAACAVDALGPEKVWAVMLPYAYTSSESLEDAAECAKLLGVRYDVIPISPAVEAFQGMLQPSFDGRPADITEENLQSRVRGITLMALSNKFGHMVLTTGNKSEMSVGYATLYGDTCGGYSVLKDVYKTAVYELSRFRNQCRLDGLLGPEGRVIPERIITRPPTAELRPDQTDQDSLPPYDQLDQILEHLVEGEMGADEIIAKGFPRDVVTRVQHLLYIAEYKRRQAPPGVKITRRNFGRDRRYPITNAYRDKV